MSKGFTTFHEFRKRYPIKPNDENMLLGSGSYGKVVKVEDQVETEWVAVKISEFKGNDTKSLKAEVELAQKVPRQANIARYDACYRLETDTSMCDFAIMRYYPDGNLADLMKKVTLTPSQINDVTRGVLLGLQHLHKLRIVHRDFKPANILISRDNQGRFIPKIADFGLSKLVTEEEIDSSDFDLSDGRGTPSYKAPEQIEGGRVSFNLDLWAFGVILYEMVTGEKPFASNIKVGTESSLKRDIEKKIISVVIPDRIESIAEPYQAMIKRCLVKDIHQRVRKADELLDLLDGITVLLVEAQTQIEKKNYNDAIAKFEQILEKREFHQQAIAGIKLCKELAEKQHIESLILQADKYFRVENWGESIRIFQEVLVLDESQGYARRRLGDAQANQTKQINIQKLFQEADTLFTQQAFNKAKLVYEKILLLDAQNPQALSQIAAGLKAEKERVISELLRDADNLFNQKDFQRAKTKYETVLKSDATNQIAHKRIADCIVKLTPAEDITDAWKDEEEQTDVFEKPSPPKEVNTLPEDKESVPPTWWESFNAKVIVISLIVVSLIIYYFINRPESTKSPETTTSEATPPTLEKATKKNEPTPVAQINDNKYQIAIRQAEQALTNNNWSMAKYYVLKAIKLNPTKQAKQLQSQINTKEQQQLKDIDNQAEEQQRQAQTDYNNLIDRGVASIENGNNKSAAIAAFNSAKQLANQHELLTNKSSENYTKYLGKANKIFASEDYEAAIAWYKVAQALNDTPEIRSKIIACEKLKD